VRAAVEGLSPSEATSPTVLRHHLRGIVETLGPASLFYFTEDGVVAPADVVTVDSIAALVAAASAADLDESGIEHVTSPTFAIVDDGVPVAACGYRDWPHGIAHVSVLTHPDHRNRGLARRVGRAAAADAIGRAHVPQWRARPESSKAVARAIGFRELGTQLSVRLARPESN
jgi:GNAT superfamily N-acetyltransferase